MGGASNKTAWRASQRESKVGRARDILEIREARGEAGGVLLGNDSRRVPNLYMASPTVLIGAHTKVNTVGLPVRGTRKGGVERLIDPMRVRTRPGSAGEAR